MEPSSNIGEQAFMAWAPEELPWSEWVKPVPFIQDVLATDASPLSTHDLPASIRFESNTAVIVNLPGAEAVDAGLTLAKRGWQAVPLFNGTAGPSPAIDVMPIVHALLAGAERLRLASAADNPMPAFLIDSRRLDQTVAIVPGVYDNRWIVLPQDFPSARLLMSRGVERVALVQRGSTAVAEDLAHVLRRWREAGLRIDVVDLEQGATERNVDVPTPFWFRKLWYVFLTMFDYRRNAAGGFGQRVPDPNTSSGRFG